MIDAIILALVLFYVGLDSKIDRVKEDIKLERRIEKLEDERK